MEVSRRRRGHRRRAAAMAAELLRRGPSRRAATATPAARAATGRRHPLAQVVWAPCPAKADTTNLDIAASPVTSRAGSTCPPLDHIRSAATLDPPSSYLGPIR